MGGAEDVAEVTVHVSAKPEKKKKSKRSSKKSGVVSSGNGGGASAEAGFGNPLYGARDDEPEVGLNQLESQCSEIKPTRVIWANGLIA